jgi:hypothetical protein
MELPKVMLHKGHVSRLPKMSCRSKRHWFSPNFIMKVKKQRSCKEVGMS